MAVHVLSMLVLTSLLAIIILILRKIFDKKISPTWKFLMWGLLGISLLIPIRISIPSQNAYIPFWSKWITRLDNLETKIMNTSIAKIIFIIWIAGILILATFYLIETIKLKRKIGKKEATEERMLKLLEQAKQIVGTKKNIKIIWQDVKKVPCIYGVLHPKILMTKEILEKEDKTILHILVHELTHEKRKDMILNRVLIIIATIYWFNPIIWFCFYQVRQDMELKTDEEVLKKLGEKENKAYAKSLVSLLQVSGEEKQAIKVLSVTDGKKNMERRIKMIKLSEKFKEYKALIGVTTLLLTICIGMLIFTQIKPQQTSQENNVQYFETPDRVIYKVKGEDSYYAFQKGEEGYQKIVNGLIRCMESLGQGTVLSSEEMEKIEQEENYIELDYDTISKNYVIAYEKENSMVIKRTDTGGVVVRNNLNKIQELKNILEDIKYTYNTQKYQMADNKMVPFQNPISYEVPSWSNELKKYEQGIYSVRLGNENAVKNFLERNQLTYPEIPQETFEKVNLVAMITKFQMDHIDTRVGGVTCYFTGMENTNAYYITFLYLSKAVNVNCIYRNYDKVTYAPVGTYENTNTYSEITETTESKEETGTITEEKAKQIAIQSLKEDGITSWTGMEIRQSTENKYYLERWTDSNKDYSTKYLPVTEYEPIDTWKVGIQDAGSVGCYVNVWIDRHTGEVLCYHWTGE